MSAPYDIHLNHDENEEGNNIGRYYVIDGDGFWTEESAVNLIESVAGCFRRKEPVVTLTIHGPCKLERDHWWTENYGVTMCYLCKRNYEEVVKE
jgi:hypothetical protein